MGTATSTPISIASGRLGRTLLATALAAILCMANAYAGAEASRDFDIPTGSLETALGKFSEQSKLQIRHASGNIAGVQVQGTKGRLQWNQVLDRLLAGTGMVWHLEDDTTVVIQAAEAAATVPAGSSSTPAPTRAPKPEKALNLPEVRVIGVAGKELDR